MRNKFIHIILVILLFSASGCEGILTKFLEKKPSNRELVLEDLTTGEKTSIARGGIEALSFSREGNQLLYLEHYEEKEGEKTIKKHRLALYHLYSEDLKYFLDGREKKMYPNFGPKGRSIIYIAEEDSKEDIYIYSLETTASIRIPDDGAPKKYPIISPDGKKILYLQAPEKERSSIVLVPTLGGQRKVVAVSSNAQGPIRIFSWANNSREFVYFRGETIVFSDLNGQASMQVDMMHSNLNILPTLTADPVDENLYYFDALNVVDGVKVGHNWYVLDRNRKNISIKRGGLPLLELGHTYSPERKYLAFTHQIE